MTEQALKRIEKGHRHTEHQEGTWCETCGDWTTDGVCDVVKLARALSRAIAALPDNAGHTDCDCARCDVERTLEEVAGE